MYIYIYIYTLPDKNGMPVMLETAMAVHISLCAPLSLYLLPVSLSLAPSISLYIYMYAYMDDIISLYFTTSMMMFRMLGHENYADSQCEVAAHATIFG